MKINGGGKKKATIEERKALKKRRKKKKRRSPTCALAFPFVMILAWCLCGVIPPVFSFPHLLDKAVEAPPPTSFFIKAIFFLFCFLFFFFDLMNRWSCIHLYMFFILAMGAFPVFTQLSVCLYRVAVFSFFLFLSSLVVFLTSSPPSLRRCRYTMKCLRQLTKMQSEGKRRTSIKRVTHRCRSHLFFFLLVFVCIFVIFAF